jgi:NMD protein affecting ribosome stability and mRNA decay
MRKKRFCLECGNELPEGWNEEYCEDCLLNDAASIIHTEELWPDEDDFD